MYHYIFCGNVKRIWTHYVYSHTDAHHKWKSILIVVKKKDVVCACVIKPSWKVDGWFAIYL